jgi:3-hydroxybutyryl-CoA dehydrogenase
MKNISVIGSGTMGNGIAHVFAQSGFDVSLIDISEAALKKALETIEKNLERQLVKGSIDAALKESTLKRIKTFTVMNDGVKNADLVVEAATENPDIKLKIFKDLDAACPAATILATNTSSISITKIAAVTKRPEKVIGMHFMNPVPVMKLVEVIRGYSTSAEVTKTIMELSKNLGKVPVEVNDYPGFVANKILMPMINEAIITLHEGTAGVHEIDTVMKLGGLDVCLSILRVLQEGYGNPKYAPCPLLVNMVTAGHLGVKTGKGFYSYTKGSKDLVVSEQFLKA